MISKISTAKFLAAALLLCAPRVTLGGTIFAIPVDDDPTPIGSWDFTVGGRIAAGDTVKVTAKAKDGSTFDQQINFTTSDDAAFVRDTVLNDLQTAGWDAKAAGKSGISITGHKGSEITEVNFGNKNGDIAAALDASDGVKQGQATVGEKYKFAFLPLDSGSTVLTTNGTVTAVLNSTIISAAVFSGQDVNEVANDLFAAMLAASVQATLNGNEISFIDDPSGAEVLETDLTLDAAGLESLIFIPDREVIPEPSTFLLFGTGLVCVFGYGRRRKGQPPVWWRLWA